MLLGLTSSSFLKSSIAFLYLSAFKWLMPSCSDCAFNPVTNNNPEIKNVIVVFFILLSSFNNCKYKLICLFSQPCRPDTEIFLCRHQVSSSENQLSNLSTHKIRKAMS